MKGKRITIVILLFLLLSIFAGVFYLNKSQEVLARTSSAVGDELSKALGSVVKVGQVEITSYNSISVHDVTIYDKQAQEVLTSEKIIVTYHPLDILRGQTVVGAISDIRLEEPTLWLAQTSSGRWNVQDLLQDDHESKPTLQSKITLVDGKVLLKAANGTWVLENVNGVLDCGQNPTIDLDVKAICKGETIKAKGSMNSQGRSAITLYASALAIADYQVFLPKEPLGLVGGSLKNVEFTVIRDKGNLEWTGTTDLAGVDIDIDEVPVRNVQGNMILTNKNMYLFATARVFDQPVDVRGSIRTDANQPILNLVISGNDFDPSVVTKELPITGKLSFKAEVTGLTTSPIIAGEAQLASGKILGYEVSNAHANLYIVNKVIKINQFSGNVLGGAVTATGTVDPGVGSYDLALQAQQIDMEKLGEFLPNSTGYGNVNVKIKGTGAIEGADVQGAVTLGQGAIAGVNFHSLGIGFYRHDGIIDLDYANIGLGKGMVTVSGQINQQKLKLTAYGNGIPLAELDQQKKGIIAGNGDFVAQITGTLSEPECNLDFTALQGQAFYQPFAQATGNIQLNRQQVTLNNLEVVDGVTTHKIQGTIGLQGQREINATVSSKRARAENIIKLLVPGEKLTGNVDNEIQLTGSLDEISAVGRLQLTDGSFRGQLIAKGQGSYTREKGVTAIHDFSIDSLNTQIKLSGNIDPNNQLDFDVVARDIDMARVSGRLPYPLIGRGQFTGKLTGTPNNPFFKGQFDAHKIGINGQEVKNVTGTVTFDGNEIQIPSLVFMQGAGKFNAAGGFLLDSHEIYGSFDVENAELEWLLAGFKSTRKDIHGRLNGHIRVGGTMDKPDIWLTGNLQNGRIKQYPVGTINIDVALENHVLKVNELSATQGTGVLMAHGTADLNGPLELEIGGRDIDAGLVAAILDTKIEPKGKMGFAAQVTGSSQEPHAAISLEIANGGVGDTTFDSLYGLLIIDKNMIHVNQVLLKKGPYRASAYGVIPIAVLNGDGGVQGTATDQMNLNLRLDEANLSILPLLTKEVSWAEGPTRGELNITGTLEKPMVNGQITVQNGEIKLAAVTSPIQKVGVDINFKGDTINVQKFDGHLGDGLYSLTGTAKFNGIKLSDYDFSLLLDKPEVKSKYFTGIIDGNLVLSNHNNKKKAMLSGKLLFENDIINIPMLPDMAPSDLDIDLDVEMRVGKKVRFYNPYLYDIVAQGRVKFAGSTLEPDFKGNIVALRGTVNYLRTQFRVNEASVSFKQFSSLEPIVKLVAQTTLQQTTVNLEINGPISGMQFSLTSEPAMRQQEILSLLTLRSRYTDKQNAGNNGMGKDELVSALGAGLQMQFMGEVEGTFRSALGLDEFRVIQDGASDVFKKKYSDNRRNTTLSQEAYNIEMSKYLTDKVLLTYTMGINYDKRDLALRYSLNRRISLNASIDEQQRTWFGVEARFKF